ncbi:MAG: type II toxin-antitoxin system RelE/ParE family toxin [Desulfotignum sp.]|nr:type II toxin-antitoxin system RelE/ParE family toxin [Desulfobacteraceae bacterium]
MTWTIEFYNSKVKIQTLELPEGIVANLIRTLELIREFGPNLGKPHTASLGKGLFEIRAKGKEGIARSFFCTVQNKKIIILHTIIKKGMKAPKKDMDLAIKRMKVKQSD